MALDQKNPFDPKVERVPLKLMLDAYSLGSLEGRARRRAEFLCELCWTDAIEALWSWKGEPLEGHISRTILDPVEHNRRTVRRLDEPPACFIGGVAAWDQFDRFADQQDYGEEERQWFIYYGSLAHFSDRSGQHYLVTADERLLREAEGDRGWFRQGRHRITSVGRALFMAGMAMKAHGIVFYESPQPKHTIYTESHSMYEWLAMDLVQGNRRFIDCVKRPGETKSDFYGSEREELVESIYARASDFLRGRDRIAMSNAKQQNEGTLHDMRYDLSAMIASVAAVFDAIAVLSKIVFDVVLETNAEAATTLRRREFRKKLRQAGAPHLCETAGQLAPFLSFIWEMRNPVFHRHGLPGYNLHVLGTGTEPKITVTSRQVESLKESCHQNGEDPSIWGLEEAPEPIGSSVKPLAFSNQLALKTIKNVDLLLDAFAADRAVALPEISWTPEQRKMIERFRWLAGIPDEV